MIGLYYPIRGITKPRAFSRTALTRNNIPVGGWGHVRELWAGPTATACWPGGLWPCQLWWRAGTARRCGGSHRVRGPGWPEALRPRRGHGVPRPGHPARQTTRTIRASMTCLPQKVSLSLYDSTPVPIRAPLDPPPRRSVDHPSYPAGAQVDDASQPIPLIGSCLSTSKKRPRARLCHDINSCFRSSKPC
jgi:hypothetical protein